MMPLTEAEIQALMARKRAIQAQLAAGSTGSTGSHSGCGTASCCGGSSACSTLSGKTPWLAKLRALVFGKARLKR